VAEFAAVTARKLSRSVHCRPGSAVDGRRAARTRRSGPDPAVLFVFKRHAHRYLDSVYGAGAHHGFLHAQGFRKTADLARKLAAGKAAYHGADLARDERPTGKLYPR